MMKRFLILLICYAVYSVWATEYIITTDINGTISATETSLNKYVLDVGEYGDWEPDTGGSHGGADWIITDTSITIGGIHTDIGAFVVSNANASTFANDMGISANSIFLYNGFLSAQGRGHLGGGGGGGGGGGDNTHGYGGSGGNPNGAGGSESGAYAGGPGGDGGDGTGLFAGDGGEGDSGSGDGGVNGGYNRAYDLTDYGNRRESVTNRVLFIGSGGGGGAGGSGGQRYTVDGGGGGGGGAGNAGGCGGGRIRLIATETFYMTNFIIYVDGGRAIKGENGSDGSTVGGNGGDGGDISFGSAPYSPTITSGGTGGGGSPQGQNGFSGGAGGIGAGGGVLIEAPIVTLTTDSEINARNGAALWENANGGTVKLFYETLTNNATIRATQLYEYQE